MHWTYDLTNCLPIGVVLTTAQGRIEHCNSVMADWFCFDPQHLQGHCITEFWPELTPYLRWQEAGGRVRLAQQENWLVMRVTVQRLARDDQEWLVWSFIPEYSRDLEQSQQEFIATISHELRTPLTSIKGFIETLLQSQHRLSADQIRHFLEIVQGQVGHLTELVETVLQVSRWQATPGRFRPVQIADLVPEVMQELEWRHSVERVEWRIQEVPPVWSDPDLLVPILVRVLDYALTHTPGQTRVQVRAWSQGTGLQIGVPELELGDLWYPLGPTRPNMGLAITQMLVERVHGRLVLNQGLILELPRAARVNATNGIGSSKPV
ncbi:MAG: PAS domain-containing sensor histidine kinase [Gloeomargarita sp. SKYG116]|nr:PAS domain-containing sensor histidine kinase [Gloeomargarita sp. SKYG116]MCS7225640.1 PAS domain-containing sensor histidine kinase [Gloeomargarita sp. SKYB31]MDW8401157.1 histidine kinase dimerization/phospho-acceptor domain-containing protein [Gloeomargarita sp. SKYGB_i_bin116]